MQTLFTTQGSRHLRVREPSSALRSAGNYFDSTGPRMPALGAPPLGSGPPAPRGRKRLPKGSASWNGTPGLLPPRQKGSPSREPTALQAGSSRAPSKAPTLDPACRALWVQGGRLLQQAPGLVCVPGRPGTAGQGRCRQVLHGVQGPWCEGEVSSGLPSRGCRTSCCHCLDHRVMGLPRARLWARCQAQQDVRHAPALEQGTV